MVEDKAKDCMHRELPGERFHCDLKVHSSEPWGGLYNCKREGRPCVWFKTEEQHQRECEKRHAEWERETYERLKAKFEPQ